MKPKLIHQEAMNLSFRAKQALEEGNHIKAFDLYQKAAELESQVAEFYFDKPDLEPTRSVIIRSAAFLNLKAGLIEQSKKFIFFGLLHSKDHSIISQLNTALEIAVSLSNLAPEATNREFNYLNILRQRSIHYSIEPSNLLFGQSVGLEMIKDFADNYLKSLRAYAVSAFKRSLEATEDTEEAIQKEVRKMINPLVTNSSYGSFKFSIANDPLPREGETREIIDLKAGIVEKYHHEIFVNPLSINEIKEIKQVYSEEEINAIFRPLTKIKSNSATYKVSYFDSDSLNKKYAKIIVNKQRKQLLTTRSLSPTDIGELESLIVHKRSFQSGKVSKQTIFKEELKSYETDISINQIEPTDVRPIVFTEEIIVNMNFTSDQGFSFSFDDLNIENTDIEYHKSLNGFYSKFYFKLIELANMAERNQDEQKSWDVVQKLIGNPDALKK